MIFRGLDYSHQDLRSWDFSKAQEVNRVNFDKADLDGVSFRAASMRKCSFRKGGTEWFADEAVTMGDVYRVLDAWSDVRPDVVVAHDGPTLAYEWLTGRHKPEHGQSADMLQIIWEEVHPSLWIHGHHHHRFDEEREGTRFISLDRLCYRDGNEDDIIAGGIICLDL